MWRRSSKRNRDCISHYLRRGLEWIGSRGLDWRVMPGLAGKGTSVKVRLVNERRRMDWLGSLGDVGHVTDGFVLLGGPRQSRWDLERHSRVRSEWSREGGTAGQSRTGKSARSSEVQGTARQSRLGSRGLSAWVLSWHVSRVELRQGSERSREVWWVVPWCGKTEYQKPTKPGGNGFREGSIPSATQTKENRRKADGIQMGRSCKRT